MKFTRITIDSSQMDGIPCIRHLRIPVATVVAMVADGMNLDEIMKSYPDIEREDIKEALYFASNTLQERQIPIVSIPAA